MKLPKKIEKYFPIDIFDSFKQFVYYKHPNISDDVFNALVHTTYDIHATRNNNLYSLTEDDKKFVLKFAEDLRKLNNEYSKQNIINIEEQVKKQIKIPFQFYTDDEFGYFKTEDGTIYTTELYIGYFEIYEVVTDEWDDCPKLSKSNLPPDDFIYENRGCSDKWEYYKVLTDNGFYCALYRVLDDKNKFQYRFDFVEYRDGKLYIKDKTNAFTVEINLLNVLYWYRAKF